MLRRIAFIVFAQRIGLTLEEIGGELSKLPPHRATAPPAAGRARATGSATGHRGDAGRLGIVASVNPRAWFAFLSVSILWGIPYFFIKIAVDDGVPPAFLAWARVTMAALLLGAISWRLGLLSGLRGRWRVLGLYAVVEIVIPFPLIAAGEQAVSSSLTAILIASVPLIVALLALRFDHSERATGSRLLGLFVGFAGVIALVGLDIAGDVAELLGAAAILVAALGYAAGPMVLKRSLASVDPRALMAGALGIAALVLTPAAWIAPPTSALSTEAVIAIVVLGVLCTAVAFVLFGVLIAEVGPGRASVITYVAPMVAVALGVAVLGERPGAGAIAGLLLIIAGSWLSTDGRLPPGLAAVITRSQRSRSRERPAGASVRPVVGRTPAVAAHPTTGGRRVRMTDLNALPDDLPVPGDDGAADHLPGSPLPALAMVATNGETVELDQLGSGRSVLYFYPLTGRPGVDPPDGWDSIPGARGCTPEACDFRDHHADLAAAGAGAVYGVSSQGTEYQRELVERLSLPFSMLSDPDLTIAAALRLPTFTAAGRHLYSRLTLIVDNAGVEHVFYPIFPPNEHAREVLTWLDANPA